MKILILCIIAFVFIGIIIIPAIIDYYYCSPQANIKALVNGFIQGAKNNAKTSTKETTKESN